MFNFSETASKLVSSYLGDRSPIVANNGTFSRPLITLRGFPQGSILGQLLYSLYSNDLPLQIKYSYIQMYVDVVPLYMSYPRHCTDVINDINVIECTRIELIHTVKKFGVTFNRTFTWWDQINHVCGRT